MKFKVGDRVAAYFDMQRHTGELEVEHPNGSFDFKADKFSSRRPVHPKQCRRLVKKERRRIIASINYNGELTGASIIGSSKGLGKFFSSNDEVEFVEVKNK